MIVPGSVNPILMAMGGDPLDELGKIERSVRLRSDASAFLKRAPTAAGNRQTWTISAWFKRGKATQYGNLLNAWESGSETSLHFSNDSLYFLEYQKSNYLTSAVYRDSAAWLHLVLVADTTNATATERLRLYVNGRRVTSFSSYVEFSQNAVTAWNSMVPHRLGNLYAESTSGFDGGFAHYCSVDGQALSPDIFGAYHPKTGQWRPKSKTAIRAAVLAGGGVRNGWGINGFFLPFDDGTSLNTLGYDRSQSDTDTTGNNWTVNNISLTAGATYDSMLDTPTNGYCVFNNLNQAALTTISSGNLDATLGDAANGRLAWGTIGMSSGKWYAEFLIRTTGPRGMNCGLIPIASASNGNRNSGNTYVGSASGEYAYGRSTDLYQSNAYSLIGGVFANTGTALPEESGVVGLGFDADAGTLSVYLNGVHQAVSGFTSIPAGTYFFACSAAAFTWSANFGQRPFAYTPPTGFKSLCTKNLPFPKVPKSSSAFVAVTDAGANIASTLAAAAPWTDWIRIYKRRDSAEGWRWQFSDDPGYAFDSSSNTAGRFAYPALAGTSYVGYSLRVSASNGVATGRLTHINGAANVVNDGLSNTRKAIILTNEAGSGWWFYHPDLEAGKLLYLNTTAAATTDATLGSVTASGFTVAAALASGTYRWVAFAEVDGFLKLFKHSGSGNSDGPFDSAGMLPAFAVLKSSSYAGSNWPVYDGNVSPHNQANASVYLNTSGAEQVTSVIGVDLVFGGVKQRNSDTNRNASGHTYVGMMLAAFPCRYVNAR